MEGLRSEQKARAGFYTATNIINESIKSGLLVDVDESFRTGQGKADLVNYVMDGTIPLSKDWDKGLSSSQIVSKAQYTLQVMFLGIQLEIRNQVTIKPDAVKEYNKIRDIYKKNGGELEY
ncbi:hypothetical protein DVR12_26925 [Chitinophaga silvatica]|uniref:Uncharacterized protein n=2 Tax=Chitinophaga silvatica TaxID=2282649 RepID=A0A3E1Y1X7_9BACT|nr:hypothetical protein DVR12_26925 [Chitinophaga silvatica]